MKIYLLRHGQSTSDIEKRYGGDYDDELTKLGIEQANKIAKKLQKRQIEIIYTSPKVRAKSVANILSTQINCDVEIIEELRERNSYGVITGLTKEEAQEKHYNDFINFEKYKFNYDITNSEKYEDFKDRANNIFDKLIKKSKHNNIVIVTHGGLIRFFMREILKKGEFIELNDCALIELNYNNNKFEICNIENAII